MTDEAGAHSVKLPAFEGPLDLLLHLIRINEVDIYDIPIVEITRQYDEYLEVARELDLHIAGEYLVMASTLVHIKSKLLLPHPPAGQEPEEDPRADLIRQLIEHEKLRGAADNLRSLAEVREDVFFRPGDPLEEFAGESFLTVSIFDLVTALQRALERLEAGRTVELNRDEFSVEDKIDWILKTLTGEGARQFDELLDPFPSRSERVVIFLALLELVRQRKIMVVQRETGGEILVMARPGPAAGPIATVAGPGGEELSNA
jgi:segregation and condensation protein A